MTRETCDLLRISIQASKSEKDIAQYQGQLAAHQELASQGYCSLRNDAEGSQNADGHTVFTFNAKSTHTNFNTWLYVLFTAAVGEKFWDS